MRKAMLLLSVICLFAMTISCGGGGSDTGHAGTSQVTITVKDSGRSASITTEKNSLLAMAESLFMVITGSGIALAQIPPDVTHILFTISAPDMVTITRDVPVAGRSSITETFTIPNGKNRCFLVQAQNASGDTLYRPAHEICRDLDGEPVTVTINMQESGPPIFEGLVSAAYRYVYEPVQDQETRIGLSWDAASDNQTTQEEIVYLIYMATTSGEEDFNTPYFTTDPGATSYSGSLAGIVTGPLYFVVRATDEAGNVDTNFVEMLAEPDYEGPFIESVYPEEDSPQIADVITVNFSEPIDPNSVTSISFTVLDWSGDPPLYVTGTVGCSGSTVTFRPDVTPLNAEHCYRATVTNQITDLVGNNAFYGTETPTYIWVFGNCEAEA